MSSKILFFEEFQGFCESAQSLSHEEFCNAFDAFLDEFLEEKMNHIEKIIENYGQEKHQEDAQNLKRIDEIWGLAFSLYAFYIDTASSFRDSLLQYLKEYYKVEDEANGFKVFTVLTYINGRALQVANEILVLLRNGYADGAYARFRTLYELSIVAHFINHHGDTVAQAYMEYDGNRYGWAAAVFPNRKAEQIPFSQIEKNCGVDTSSWKHEYSLTNKLIHASSQGTFSRLSVPGFMDEILIGPSTAGIVAPATNSLQALFEINKLFFDCCIQSPITALWVSTLYEIKNKCCTWFETIEKNCFTNEESTEKM